MPRFLAATLFFTATAALAVEGGLPDQADPSVGMLWLTQAGKTPSLCTGTLIAPNVVITAGHCAHGRKVASFYTGAGATGTPSKFVTPAGGGHAVAEAAVFPGYADSMCPNASGDVALVRLSAPVAGAKAIALGAALPAKGKVCQAVGYGIHKNADGTVTLEQKRRADETVVNPNGLFVQVNWKSGVADEGDSGGPLLCGGIMVGVVSCNNDAGARHRTEFYASIGGGGVRQWIDDTLHKWAKGASAPVPR